MGLRILADTNCVSDYLSGKISQSAIGFINEATVELSVINRMELLAWNEASEEQMEIISEFIETCVIHGLEEAIILTAVAFRRDLKLKLPDTIIAATAVVKNIPLVTHNKKDFQNIKGLKVIDQYKI